MKCPRCAKEIWYMSSGAILVCADCPLILEQLMAGAPRDPLLVEREKTHGSFEKNARISQILKRIFKEEGIYPLTDPIQCEALDMIALKLSRILSGQANYKDHWIDVSGYAMLAAEACDENKG